MQILIIEDEEKVARALKEGLEQQGYAAEVALSGEDGFNRLQKKPFDLLILDLMLPGHSGFDILKNIRHEDMRLPVLILSARDNTDDKVTGLDLGADDYLAKPFAFPELLARIRVLLRRGNHFPDTHLQLADLELDLVDRFVKRSGTRIFLTNREFDLLKYLMENQHQIVSREMLTKDVWQVTNRFSSMDNLIDVHITRLRHKIDEPFDLKLLHTVRGVGFVLSEKEVS
ncbi:MAG: response regulator [Chlorobi bacterium]|nr:response regulator [Chlorobiota bacterium]